MGQYAALLRGINVGGKNLIKMIELKACFEDNGFRNVATYIQSGNVLFESGGSSTTALVQRIEEILGARFGYRASVVIRSRKQLRDTVERAPESFGVHPTRYRYDVIFLKPPLTSAVAMRDVQVKQGVDQAQGGTGVLYFSRLIRRATQSQLNRLISLPIYQSMTIRNWNTTTRLLQMMDG